MLQNPAVSPPNHPREHGRAQEHGWKPRRSSATVHTAHVQQPDRRRGSSAAVRQSQHSADHGPVVRSQATDSIPSILILLRSQLALLKQWIALSDVTDTDTRFVKVVYFFFCAVILTVTLCPGKPCGPYLATFFITMQTSPH